MSTGDPFFKIRPTKRSNPESRTTLDSIHHAHLNRLVEESENVEEIEQEFRLLRDKINTCQDDILKVKLEKELQDLVREYRKRKSGSAVYDYFLETGNLLYQYYDIQDKSSRGVESRSAKPVKIKPGSIFAVLEQAAEDDISGNVIMGKGEDMRRDRLLEQYLQKIDPEHARSTVSGDDPYGECEECGCEMIFSVNEALFTCTKCGYQEFVLVD